MPGLRSLQLSQCEIVASHLRLDSSAAQRVGRMRVASLQFDRRCTGNQPSRWKIDQPVGEPEGGLKSVERFPIKGPARYREIRRSLGIADCAADIYLRRERARG